MLWFYGLRFDYIPICIRSAKAAEAYMESLRLPTRISESSTRIEVGKTVRSRVDPSTHGRGGDHKNMPGAGALGRNRVADVCNALRALG